MVPSSASDPFTARSRNGRDRWRFLWVHANDLHEHGLLNGFEAAVPLFVSAAVDLASDDTVNAPLTAFEQRTSTRWGDLQPSGRVVVEFAVWRLAARGAIHDVTRAIDTLLTSGDALKDRALDAPSHFHHGGLLRGSCACYAAAYSGARSAAELRRRQPDADSLRRRQLVADERLATASTAVLHWACDYDGSATAALQDLLAKARRANDPNAAEDIRSKYVERLWF